MFKNLSIASKLAIGFTIFSVSIFIINIGTYRDLLNMHAFIRQFSQEVTPAIESTNRLSSHAWHIRNTANQCIFADAAELAILESDFKKYSAEIPALMARIKDSSGAFGHFRDSLVLYDVGYEPDHERLLEDLEGTENSLAKAIGDMPQLFAARRSELDSAQAIGSLTASRLAEINLLMETAIGRIESIAGYYSGINADLGDNGDRYLSSTESFTIVITFVAIGICVFLARFFTRMITRPTRKLMHRITDIAEGEGDLTMRLDVTTNDELGILSHRFNDFIDHLDTIIGSVKQTAKTVDIATREVSAGTQGISHTSQEQASAIQQVAATIEEMAATIKHTADNAVQGRTKTRDTEKSIHENAETARQLSRAMDEISEVSSKIGDIIITVNEVAFQTNLLALNAAVEAARAGEHGKGFAVVADEVRALAQRSAAAAGEIRNLVEDTVNKIATGDAMAKKAGEAFTSIIDQIEELSQTMDEIAEASNEQAVGVDEVNRAISQIDSSTQQNASTTEQLSSAADNLSSEAQALARTVERFKVSDIMSEISSTLASMEFNSSAAFEPHTAPTVEMADDGFEEF